MCMKGVLLCQQKNTHPFSKLWRWICSRVFMMAFNETISSQMGAGPKLLCSGAADATLRPNFPSSQPPGYDCAWLPDGWAGLQDILYVSPEFLTGAALSFGSPNLYLSLNQGDFGSESFILREHMFQWNLKSRFILTVHCQPASQSLWDRPLWLCFCSSSGHEQNH